ncbi:MAG: 6-phosphogluconolactonase [Longimicrobiales bacterium]
MEGDLIVHHGAARMIVFQQAVFAAGAASRIIAELATAHQGSRARPISFALTGGSTPREVYRAIARVPGLPWTDIAIWFGDERAVPPDHADSNYRMVVDTLLAHVAVPSHNIHRMEAERTDLEAAALDYERSLPRSIDVLLLGVGSDGHTASIFPHSPALSADSRDVVVARSPVHSHARLTITPRVIQRAAACIVLASGAEKAEAVARALDAETPPDDCPARLARKGVWLLDSAAAALANPGQ